MSAKRKACQILEEEEDHCHRHHHHQQEHPTSSSSSSSSYSKRAKPRVGEEKRLKIFRKHAPKTFLQRLERAQTQRMIVIGRTRGGTEDCPTERIDIVGTTGNIYRVTIDKEPSCTCPDSRKGNECKHKIYALCTVLRAPYELQYQRALLSTELKTILEHAPPIPTALVVGDNDEGNSDSTNDRTGTRKPVEGECPICYMDFDPEHNELVWCKAACGNNMHKTCFDQWAASHRGGGSSTVRCVYCRTPWQVDVPDLKTIITSNATSNGQGYINVAQQFGLSGIRDMSSYHQPWARRAMYSTD